MHSSRPHSWISRLHLCCAMRLNPKEVQICTWQVANPHTGIGEMALLEDLIKDIRDAELREAILKEVKQLKSEKSGLAEGVWIGERKWTGMG
jgi:hypothetical protein